MVAVTRIKAEIATLEAGQAASLYCQMGIYSASKLCARSLLALPGKHMSHHETRTKHQPNPAQACYFLPQPQFQKGQDHWPFCSSWSERYLIADRTSCTH